MNIDYAVTISQLDRFEDELLEKLVRHPVLTGFTELDDNAVRQVLIERVYLSLMFTPLYDLGTMLLTDPEALRVCRDLIREEYPAGELSHRELLASDLRAVGVRTDVVLHMFGRASEVTREVATDMFNNVGFRPLSAPNTTILAALRFWGEVTVAVEYAQIVPRLVRMGLPESKSRFYVPHRDHDRKTQPLHQMREPSSHSDEMARVMVGLIERAQPPYDDLALQLVAEVERRVFEAKYKFWDQFLPFLDR